MAYFLSLIAIIGTVLVTIFWMIIGWRAMLAHESIAQSINRLSSYTNDLASTCNDLKNITENHLKKP